MYIIYVISGGGGDRRKKVAREHRMRVGGLKYRGFKEKENDTEMFVLVLCGIGEMEICGNGKEKKMLGVELT